MSTAPSSPFTLAAFDLDPRLAADTAVVGDWPLCRVLRMNDARYPWYILVPRRKGLVEWVTLDAADRAQLLAESALLSEALIADHRGYKLNMGALGNVVAQYHLHHVMRHIDDPAWPGPVWGHSAPQPMSAERLNAVCERARQYLNDFSAATKALIHFG